MFVHQRFISLECLMHHMCMHTGQGLCIPAIDNIFLTRTHTYTGHGLSLHATDALGDMCIYIFIYT